MQYHATSRACSADVDVSNDSPSRRCCARYMGLSAASVSDDSALTINTCTHTSFEGRRCVQTLPAHCHNPTPCRLPRSDQSCGATALPALRQHRS